MVLPAFPFDLAGFLLAAGVVTGAYIVFGISAFGAAMFTVPLLSHYLPLDFVLPMCAMLDVAAAFALGTRISKDANWGEIKWMIPAALAGATVGVTLLVNLPKQIVVSVLGTLLMAYSIYALRQGEQVSRVSARWAPFVGFFGGAMGTLFGIAAPPYAIYLSRRLFDARALRATLSNMVIFSTSIRALVFLASGLILWDRVIAFIALVPFMLIGIRIGTRIAGRISRGALLRVISVVLLAMGASLIARGLGLW